MKFGFLQFSTEQSIEFSVFGLIGFGPGLFGAVFGPRFFLPTPSRELELILRSGWVRQCGIRSGLTPNSKTRDRENLRCILGSRT